jgi:hypothetical protein
MHHPLTRSRVDADRARLLAAARDLVQDEGSDTFVAVGGEIVGVTSHAVRAGRLFVTVERAWSWPGDEPDAVGEIVVTARHTCTAVQLVGWWSPVTVSGQATGTLVLDLAEARVRSGADVLTLEDDEAIDSLLH